MATVKNFTNFTGTINGLLYYTKNGKQFVRVDAKKRTPTKSKEIPKEILPAVEAFNTIKALQSLNHLVNALKNEFGTLKTPVRRELKSTIAESRTDHANTPTLEHAVRKDTAIKFRVRGGKTDLHLIILQINFETGDFKRRTIALTEAHCIRKNTYTVETTYKARKGYTDLLFLYGECFLKVVAIEGRNFQ